MVTLLVIFLKKVVKPFRVIADAAQKIALGEYETVITVDANDEIGVLGESFNAMSRDISARTAALMKSNESLAEAQRIARLGNWEWDIVKNELFWSDEIYRIFGLLPREFEATYEAFLQCVHPDDREYVKKSVNDALFAKKPYEINHRILLQDASVRIVHEKASVVFGDEGKAIRMVGTVQDVTEQKSLETQLRKLSSAIEQSPNTVVITDTKGDIQYVNPTFLAKTGYTLEEVMGQNPRVLKSGLMPDEVYKRLWETVSAGGVWQGELCNKKKNGELYWELVHISPLRNTEGVITSYLALKDDITAIRRAEDEKKALREQLFHSQKMESVGKLAGGIAHDFNNILTAISGYGSLLEMEAKEGTPSREYVRKILSSVERAVNLVQGMLTFSRKKDSDLKPEDVNAIVRNVEDLLIRLIGEKVKLVIALADKECVVVADSGQIEQVLMNLAANARDAMPEGGSLFISTGIVKLDHEFIKLHKYGKVGLYGVISVSDTGMGMDEKTKSRIFEPFFTTKEVGKGTGLGLAIVYGIMKQHDGHINVYSEPGKGTTFKMYLPMAASRAVREEQQELQPVAGGRETILLADDDGDVRDVIASVLKGSGYKVIEAINGEDALHKFNDNKENIQLLVVDVMMPGKNGREVYDEIRKARPDMRTLFMSGYAEEVISETIILEEGLNFISKPVSPAGMLRKVRTVLDT
jgi:two-component system NtrC family sensor kinase